MTRSVVSLTDGSFGRALHGEDCDIVLGRGKPGIVLGWQVTGHVDPLEDLSTDKVGDEESARGHIVRCSWVHWASVMAFSISPHKSNHNAGGWYNGVWTGRGLLGRLLAKFVCSHAILGIYRR